MSSTLLLDEELLATGTATVEDPTVAEQVQRSDDESERFYEVGSDAISRALSRDSQTFLRQARQEQGQ